LEDPIVIAALITGASAVTVAIVNGLFQFACTWMQNRSKKPASRKPRRKQRKKRRYLSEQARPPPPGRDLTVAEVDRPDFAGSWRYGGATHPATAAAARCSAARSMWMWSSATRSPGVPLDRAVRVDIWRMSRRRLATTRLAHRRRLWTGVGGCHGQLISSRT
jgi:hypothetical protein